MGVSFFFLFRSFLTAVEGRGQQLEGRCSQWSTPSPSSSHQRATASDRSLHQAGTHAEYARQHARTHKCTHRQVHEQTGINTWSTPPSPSDPHTKSCHRAPGAQHQPTVPVLPHTCSTRQVYRGSLAESKCAECPTSVLCLPAAPTPSASREDPLLPPLAPSPPRSSLPGGP